MISCRQRTRSLSLSLKSSGCFLPFSSGFMDATPWTQGFQDIKLAKTMEEVGNNNNNNNRCGTMAMVEKKARPQEQLNCPRCNSTNTKFCYYNNYSLTQPRYFCKTCRRYWTAGGSLRNVPVGGGSRKNKRSSSSNSTPTSSSTSFMSSSSSASSSKLLLPDLNPPNLSQFSSHHQNPSKAHHGQDLNLGFPLSIQETSTQGTSISYNCYNYIDQVSAAEQEQQNLHNQAHNPSSCASTASPLSALELLRSGIASRGLNSYIPTPMPDSNALYPSGFPLQDLKPALTFSVDGLGNRYGVQDTGGRMFFPFGEVKQLPNTSEVDQSKSQGNPTSQGGYWNGMLGGGSW